MLVLVLNMNIYCHILSYLSLGMEIIDSECNEQVYGTWGIPCTGCIYCPIEMRSNWVSPKMRFTNAFHWFVISFDPMIERLGNMFTVKNGLVLLGK